MTKLTAFSQIDTDTTYVKCLPIPVIRSILKDLVSGDSTKMVLTSVESEMELLNMKIMIQDSIIDSFKYKEENYERIINENRRFLILENHINNLEDKLKLEKKKNKLKTISSVGLIGVLTYFLISK